MTEHRAVAALLAALAVVLLALALAPTAAGASIDTSTAAGLPADAPVAPVGPAEPLGPDAPDQLHEVAVRDNYFEPEVITVSVGAVVRWTNRGQNLHSTTSRNGFWNWTLVPGGSFSVRFLSPGTYDYYCIYHEAAGMTGRVVVTDAPPTPGPTQPPGPTPPGPPEPTPPIPPTVDPTGGEIVYQYQSEDPASQSSELFTVRSDGTGKQQLTVTANTYEAQPSWSPDRNRIVYPARLGGSGSAPWALHVLDRTTGQSRQITTGPQHYEPDWKPDGTAIAFTSITSLGGVTRSAIRTVAPDGSQGRVLVTLDSTSYALADPTWSPDGTQIAFTVRSDATGGDLYVMDADGRNARRLLSRPGWDDLDAAWSPDGRYIAFASGWNRGAIQSTVHDIWLYDTQSGTVGTVVTQPEWDLRRPAWSPDGTHLVFHARFETTPRPAYALYTVPATGGTVSGPLSLGAEPDWGSTGLIPAPTPMASPTATPPMPPSPPPFPTFPPPEPTEPATATPGLPPTFPPPEPTVPPPEPSPTGQAPTATPPATFPPPEPTEPPGPAVATIYLPLADNGVSVPTE